jgi:CRISPR-associated endonuclease/helicase Cas3
MTFDTFFQTAVGRSDRPYRYQAAFAESLQPFDLLAVPTGAGKTATAVLGWLWRRRFHPDLSVRAATPRRLVFCLPMRVLVEQTAGCAAAWFANLGAHLPDPPAVHVLLGGEVPRDWDQQPEAEAVLVGTQDMLLSAALNRGYAASRFRWPVGFGLLNNDCLWVFDEVQLMGVGVATSAQLAALRAPDALGTVGPTQTLWMSATMEPGWLATVDHGPRVRSLRTLDLPPEDLESPTLGPKMRASKTLGRAEGLSAADKDYARQSARRIADAHVRGSQTLVVLNTVERAKEVAAELAKIKGLPERLLIHSRYRPAERRILNDRLRSGPADRILIATQVVEAGVDLSSRTLFTELCPWPSLVQRLGRCHRYGEFGSDGARAWWIDVPDAKAAPYSTDELDDARTRLAGMEGADAAPASLPRVCLNAPEARHVLRRRDLVGLFDTAPDLSGNDIDVSRFVRETDDRDVSVFWRGWPGGPRSGPPAELPRPHREELCPAPVADFRRFLGPERRAWVWDHLADGWRTLRADEVRPGLAVLLHVSAGGYEWDGGSGRGWDAAAKADVAPVTAEVLDPEEAAGADPLSATPARASLADHTDDVSAELESILAGLPTLPEVFAEALRTAARRHDLGKAHEVFQRAMRAAGCPADGTLWAKSGGRGRLRYDGRPHFRHELASALAMLQQGMPFLACYLAGSHHGRVRLAVRSLPGEEPPDDPERRFALGVHDGEILPAAELGCGTTTPETKLDLSPLGLGDTADGRPSWLRQALALRDDPAVGPFRLAYLEAVLRAADMRASAEPGRGRATP